MDLENQSKVKELAEKYGKENIIVVLGDAEAESAGITAETVSKGDPTFAGPLGGVQLELPAYHILELKEYIDSAVYEEHIGMMEMVLDVDIILSGKIDLVINTLTKSKMPHTDGFRIRRAAVEHNVPCFTSLDTALATGEILEKLQQGTGMEILSLQEYLAGQHSLK
jgi:glycine reductase